MSTAILNAVISTEQNDTIVLRERGSVAAGVLRAVVGVIPLGGGALVAYVLLSANGPRPFGGIRHQILGWITIAVFLTALGIVPICWGLEIGFLRRAYFIHLAQRELQSSVTIAGLPLWPRRYPLSAFARILVSRQACGVFSKSYCFVVSCDGPSRRVDLAGFPERTTAEKLAEEIANSLGLKVECAG